MQVGVAGGPAGRVTTSQLLDAGALLAAELAGYDYVVTDGTGRTGPVPYPRPYPGVDLCWSGKHEQYSGNIQMITALNGWPYGLPQPDPDRLVAHHPVADGTAPLEVEADPLTLHRPHRPVAADLR